MNKSIPLPEQKGYDLAYALSYSMAQEKLRNIRDIREQCRRGEAEYQEADGQKRIAVRYLNQLHYITIPDIEITRGGAEADIPIKDKLLILHYCNTARGTPLSGQNISFHELPEGAIYFPTFKKRTGDPLARHFGDNPERIIAAGEKMCGEKVASGDAGIKLFAFPRIPVTISIWKSDAEFPASCDILFDATVPDYLPTEDIVILCETITWKLIRS